VFGVLCLLAGSTSLRAAEPDQGADQKQVYSPSKTVIVTDRAAPIMASEKTLASVPAGTVLVYSKEEGNWLLIPRFGGWLKRDNSLPIEQGEEHFTRLIKKQPSAAAFNNRGMVRLTLDQFADSAADFSEAIRLEPTSTSPYVNRGIAKTGLGDSAGALRDFDRALELSPGDTFARAHRANLHLELNNLKAARADVDELLRLDAKSFDAYNTRGILALRAGKADEAIQDFDKAIEIFPQYSGAYRNRGTVHYAKRDYEAALKDYASAQQFDPNNIRAFNDAAWLLATCPDSSVRNPKLAVQLAEQAQSLTDLPDGVYLDTLAAAYAADGQFDEAIKTAEQALKLLPETEKPATQSRLEKFRQRQIYTEEPAPIAAPASSGP